MSPLNGYLKKDHNLERNTHMHKFRHWCLALQGHVWRVKQGQLSGSILSFCAKDEVVERDAVEWIERESDM